MSFQGDIPSISLGDVFQNITANQKAGTLAIQSGQFKCRISFRGGKIISYTEETGPPLLDWLIEKGLVPAEAREDVLRRQGRNKRKGLGDILQTMGFLDRERYNTYLRRHVKEKLYDILSFRIGTFAFTSGGTEGDPGEEEGEALSLELNPMSILMEAARRSDDWQKIRKHLPSENEIYIRVDEEQQGPLPEDANEEIARQALALLDGTKTLGKVISKLPYPRFEVCTTLAQLVAGKVIRPLQGDMLLKNSRDNEDPRQKIACFKAVLEREPNNRDVLSSLADLHESIGERDESATYNKLLAISYLEEQDLTSAEAHLRKVLALNVKDQTTWQKLWDTIRRQGDPAKTLAFGNQFTAHFIKLGLLEITREHLLEMIKLFPADVSQKVELADVRFKLGDRRGALQGLTEIAGKLVRKNRLDEAEEIYARIVEYDPENAKARKVLDQIRTGKLAEKRARRRRIVHNAVAISLLLTLCLQLAYELHVQGRLFQATKSVFAEGLLEAGQRNEAMHRIQEVQRTYPFSLTSLYKAPSLLEALEEGQARAVQVKDRSRATGKPGGGPAAQPAPGSLVPQPQRK